MLSILVLLTFLTSPLMAVELNLIPYPKSNFTACNQTGPSLLCDQFGILSSKEGATINHLLKAFESKGFCHCATCSPFRPGPTFLVVMLEDGQESLAQSLYDLWSPHWKCDDAILLVVFNRSHQVKIVMGDRLHKRLDMTCVRKVESDAEEMLVNDSPFTSLYFSVRTMRSLYKRKERCGFRFKNLAILIPTVVCTCLLIIFLIVIFIRIKGWQPHDSFFNLMV